MKGMFSLSEDDLSDQAGMQILRQEGIDEDMLTQCRSNDDFVKGVAWEALLLGVDIVNERGSQGVFFIVADWSK